jgi:translation elongation factor EF-Ts
LLFPKTLLKRKWKYICLISQVYVLDEEKQLVMVMGSKPTTVEKDMENITK